MFCAFLQDNNTALHFAAQRGNTTVITHLINQGVKVDNVDEVIELISQYRAVTIYLSLLVGKNSVT